MVQVLRHPQRGRSAAGEVCRVRANLGRSPALTTAIGNPAAGTAEATVSSVILNSPDQVPRAAGRGDRKRGCWYTKPTRPARNPRQRASQRPYVEGPSTRCCACSGDTILRCSSGTSWAISLQPALSRYRPCPLPRNRHALARREVLAELVFGVSPLAVSAAATMRVSISTSGFCCGAGARLPPIRWSMTGNSRSGISLTLGLHEPRKKGGRLCLDRFPPLISGTSAGCRCGVPFFGVARREGLARPE